MSLPTPLYFESHVTIDPVTEEARLQDFKEICLQHKFKTAKLFMQKGKEFKPSDIDQFCTRRDPVKDGSTEMEIDQAFSDAWKGTHSLVIALKDAKFVVRRFKVESTLTDSRLPK